MEQSNDTFRSIHRILTPASLVRSRNSASGTTPASTCLLCPLATTRSSRFSLEWIGPGTWRNEVILKLRPRGVEVSTDTQRERESGAFGVESRWRMGRTRPQTMALPLVNDATQPSVPQHRLAQSPLCTAASLHRVACCAIIEFGASFVFLFSSLPLSLINGWNGNNGICAVKNERFDEFFFLLFSGFEDSFVARIMFSGSIGSLEILP